MRLHLQLDTRKPVAMVNELPVVFAGEPEACQSWAEKLEFQWVRVGMHPAGGYWTKQGAKLFPVGGK